jgi:H+/Cl- antiporter ClcA
MEPLIEASNKSRWSTFAAFTVATGFTSGLAGMALGLLLRFVQHIAYDYSLHEIVSRESFLAGVTASAPMRRVVVLAICGVIAGLGWWALYRFGKPLVSIPKAVKENGPAMPVLETVVHVVLQIVTVALGSPLGRESAPRELGAMLAGRVASIARLTVEDRRILVACGAGAGLAAVYNVPLGGTVFTLEALLGTFALPAMIPALITSVIAALVARIGLGNAAFYSFPAASVSSSLIGWSIVAGPLFGLCAYWFVLAAGWARAHAPRDGRLRLWCISVFVAIGFLAIPFPYLLGNGRGIVQTGLDSNMGPGLAATLFILKAVVAIGVLRAGAEGGLLTPGLSLGVTLGALLGGLWSHVWPSEPSGAFAIVGGTAFLASSMKMPLTAIALILELTRVNPEFFVPVCFAVAGSIVVFHILTERQAQPAWKHLHSDIPIGSENQAAETALTSHAV